VFLVENSGLMSPRGLLLFLASVVSVGFGAAKPPLVVVECERARRLRGPAWLRLDGGASGLRCLELMGERAVATIEVRPPRSGNYLAWARVRTVGQGQGALTLQANGQRLNSAVPGPHWAWARLGVVGLERGSQQVRLLVAGAVRLDQLLLSGDANLVPRGVVEAAGRGPRRIYFADDFMRAKREQGAWKPSRGKWAVTELKKRETFDAARSANAFSYLGAATEDGPAETLTGYPFWRNYSVEAAVRSKGGRPFGLGVLRQGDRDGYFVRCDPSAGRIELLRVLDGITDRLGSRSGRLRVDDWYHLRVEVCDGELAVAIDSHTVLRASDHALLEGLVSLWSEDTEGTLFDDVLVRSLELVVERYLPPTLGAWEVSGAWRPTAGRLLGTGRLLSRPPIGWPDFVLATTLEAGSGEAGAVFDWRDGANYAAVALVPEAAKVEVREVRAGQAQTIAAAAVPAAAARHALRVVQKKGRLSVELDGAAVLETYRPEASSGRLGLFATKEAAFGSLWVQKAQEEPVHRVHNRIFAGEDTMAAWASAASDWQLGKAEGKSVAWHEIEHWGDCTLTYRLPEPGTLPGKLGLVVRSDGKSLQKGYSLIAEPRPNSPVKLTLALDGKALATAPLPASVRALSLAWVGDSAVVLADGKRVLWHRAPRRPGGRRAGLWTDGWSPVFESASVVSSNLIDDYFETAPSGWRVGSGRWEMQNRWTCSPQWSWLGGGSDEVAMLWNKHRFKGDITVHFFAAFQMRQVGGRIYRPKDINVTICSDGQNLASGYTFLYGGWNNTRTALLKGNKVVASTTSLAARPPTLLDTTPETNQLHRKWWHMAIEKHGSKITCYVDDRLVLTYDDPEPLEGGSVCVWTHDNAIMVARAWIAYEREEGMEEPLLPTAKPSSPSAPPPPPVKPSFNLVYHDFEDGLGPWKGTAGSTEVNLVERDGGRALAVRNVHCGGKFHLRVPLEPFDAQAWPKLGFDYRFPPEAKVNLHVRTRGRLHTIVLTDPSEHVAGVPVIGQAGVVADGAWHRAEVDLRAMLRRCYPGADGLAVEEMSIGAIEESRYLTAGFGGNGAGVTYYLDDLWLGGPSPPKLAFTWDPKVRVRYSLDREPSSEPGGTAASGGKADFADLADGRWFFHLKARGADGSWSRTLHLPVMVDRQGPRVASCEPTPGSRSSRSRVRLVLEDVSGVVPTSLRVKFGGQEIRPQVPPSNPNAAWEPSALTFDPVSGELVLDLAMLPVSFSDGQELTLAVQEATDYLGNKMAPWTLRWRYDLSSDTEPPRVLRLEGNADFLFFDDFETGLGEWSAVKTTASEKSAPVTYSVIERDSTTAASGRYSLRIYNPYAGGPFAVIVRSTPFDAGRYPIVSFDYKAPPNLRADLVLTIGGTRYTVRFTDPNGTRCVGAVPGVVADGRWHHTEFNLYQMLTASLPDAPSYTISSLGFADTGFGGNNDGVEYHIDNFGISSAASSRSAPIEWKLSAHDPSGITAYQYSVATVSEPVRWRDASKPHWRLEKLGEGIFNFLVRARDGAGNWSPPIQRKVLVDDKPPVIEAVEPAPGKAAATGIVRVRLSDNGSGIHRGTTFLTVAGKKYTVAQGGVVYDARSRTLTWNAIALDEPVVFANGQQVATEVHAEDCVGNTSGQKWSWKVDYSLDKTAPATPYVSRLPTKALLRNTFESDLGLWRPYSSYGSLSRTTATAATGRRSLRITAPRSRRYFGAYAYRGRFDAYAYPIVSFDYKMPPGLAMNLHVRGESSWRTIKLTSASAYYTLVGSVPLKADGQWHHVEIDLARLLKLSPKTSSAHRLIRYVLFADFASRSVRAGTSFYIDNFAISTRETGKMITLEWNVATDPTGIAGYAWCVDKNPSTLPTKLMGTKPSAVLEALSPGKWFFHLRVRDGAGNWSAATHVPLVVPSTSAN